MLRISPIQGTGNGKILVGINSEGFSPGLYTGYIRVSDPWASNSPQIVVITLNVHDSEMTSSPFGAFETPVEGSTVRGAVPVTGWALDDIGVTAVKIYRDPLPGEQDTWNGLAYVGDAILTDGARPDIPGVFPDLPQNYKAGWGYMMLTNFLPPNCGNGEYVIHAFAFDSEGNAIQLGAKTIYCDNLHAVNPFGTIDTPTQGGSASGVSSLNFGWALTPLPNLIPPDGSTITVWVDGLPLGHPLYGSYRADIASLFPGLANSSGASGAFVLDTTSYENGIHTIAWSVADSAGNAEGIGSRYFEIFNTGVTSLDSVSLAPPQETSPSTETAGNPLVPIQTVAVRRGFRTDSEWNYFQPDGSGTIHLEMGEVDRLEICFLKARSLNGGLFVEGELHPLPIGSTLREAQGVFAWTPGPGFLGTYDLVFFADDGQEGIARIPITVTIKPKFDRF